MRCFTGLILIFALLAHLMLGCVQHQSWACADEQHHECSSKLHAHGHNISHNNISHNCDDHNRSDSIQYARLSVSNHYGNEDLHGNEHRRRQPLAPAGPASCCSDGGKCVFVLADKPLQIKPAASRIFSALFQTDLQFLNSPVVLSSDALRNSPQNFADHLCAQTLYQTFLL